MGKIEAPTIQKSSAHEGNRRDTMLHSLTEALGLPHYHGVGDIRNIQEACLTITDPLTGRKSPRFGSSQFLFDPQTPQDSTRAKSFLLAAEGPADPHDCFDIKDNDKQQKIHFHGGLTGEGFSFVVVLAATGNKNAQRIVETATRKDPFLGRQSTETVLSTVATSIVASKKQPPAQGHEHHEAHHHHTPRRDHSESVHQRHEHAHQDHYDEHDVHEFESANVLHTLTEVLGLPHYHGEEDNHNIEEACLYKVDSETGERAPRFGFANKVLAPQTPDEKRQAKDFLRAAEGPDDAWDCFDVKTSEEKMHFHGGFGGEAAYVVVLALLGNENAKHLVSVATKKQEAVPLTLIADTIVQKKKEKHDHHNHTHKESAHKPELTDAEQTENRSSSIASIVFAAALTEGTDPVIAEQFEELSKKKFAGKLDIHRDQPEALRELNEEYTQMFTAALKAFREEADVDPKKLILFLAKMHESGITVSDLEQPLAYPPRDNKQAAIILASAIEIATRPGVPQEKTYKDEQTNGYAARLKKEKGIMFFQLGTTHDTAYHVEGTSPEGKALLCSAHAHESDAGLQDLHEKTVQAVTDITSKKTSGSQQRQALVANARVDAMQTKLKPDGSSVVIPKLLNIRAVEMLQALGNTEIESRQEKAKVVKGFMRVADVVGTAVSNPENRKIKSQLDKLGSMRPVGEIRMEQQRKMTDEFPDELRSFFENNKMFTEVIVNQLRQQQAKRPVNVRELATVLAQLHDRTITKQTLPATLPQVAMLTDQQAVMILALDVALRSQPEGMQKTVHDAHVQEAARELNKQGFFYVNLMPGLGHKGAFHFEGAMEKGLVPELCAEHTHETLETIQDISMQVQHEARQVQGQLSRISARSFQPRMDIITAIPYSVPHVASGYVLSRVETTGVATRPSQQSSPVRKSTPPPRPRQESTRPSVRKERTSVKPKPKAPVELAKEKLPVKENKLKEKLYQVIKKIGAPKAPIGLKTTEDPSNAVSVIAVEASAPPKPEVSIARGASVISNARLAESVIKSSGSPVSVATETRPAPTVRLEATATASLPPAGRVSSDAESPVKVPNTPRAKLAARAAAKVEAARSTVESRPVATSGVETPRTIVAASVTVPAKTVNVARPSITAPDTVRLASVRAALQELTGAAAPKSAPENTASPIVSVKKRPNVTLVHSAKKTDKSVAPQPRPQLSLVKNVQHEAPPLAPQYKVTKNHDAPRIAEIVEQPARSNTAAASARVSTPSVEVAAPKRPVLRLVKSAQGVPPEAVPSVASVAAPPEAPTIAVRQSEAPKPTLYLVKEGNDSTSDTLPSGAVTTTDSHKATGTASVSSGSKSSSARSSNLQNTAPESKGPSTPHDTLNPPNAKAESIKKIKSENTGKAVIEAFEERQTRQEEQEMTRQMEEAIEAVEKHEEAQVAKGTTQTETAQVQQTQKQEGESHTTQEQTAKKDNKTTSSDISAQTETEDRETVVQTATGEFAKVREKTSVTSTTSGNKATVVTRREKEEANTNAAPTAQETESQDKGTIEARQQQINTTQNQKVVPIQHTRKQGNKNSKARGASMTAQLAASDGRNLPSDPYGSKDAIGQTLSEIAQSMVA